MAEADPFDLERFVTAQAPVFETALGELKAGLKRTHWIWFVFPQLKALGRSSTALFYGIGSLAEARAYLGHPVLGPRLIESALAATAADAKSLNSLFGSPDDLKFVSSMTLFAEAADDPEVFRAALDRWGAPPDARTLALLGASG